MHATTPIRPTAMTPITDPPRLLADVGPGRASARPRLLSAPAPCCPSDVKAARTGRGAMHGCFCSRLSRPTRHHAHRQTTCPEPVGSLLRPPRVHARAHAPHVCVQRCMSVCVSYAHVCEHHVSIRSKGRRRPCCPPAELCPSSQATAAAVRPTTAANTTRHPHDSGRVLEDRSRGQRSRVSHSSRVPRFILQRCHLTHDQHQPSCCC
jgi:hypothetical protein